MNIVTKINDWQAIRKNLLNKTIGFVPTMGNLHAGHASLMKRSLAENEITVVSIFVNPTQFNEKSDFDHYPKTFDQDKQLLESLGVDYVFFPSAAEMYPDDYQVQLIETNESLELEGKFRPQHFTGMLTIVLKLLNLVQATRAYFGEKDFQQLLLVKKMVSALFIPTKIIACPTIRAEDDLALSSRNSRLNPQERSQAAAFPKLLHSEKSPDKITQQLISLGFHVEYIAEKWGRLLGAVKLGDVRLIDNVALNER